MKSVMIVLAGVLASCVSAFAQMGSDQGSGMMGGGRGWGWGFGSGMGYGWGFGLIIVILVVVVAMFVMRRK